MTELLKFRAEQILVS